MAGGPPTRIRAALCINGYPVGTLANRYAALMRVPDFLVRQFYISGSLRHDGDGFSLQARNGLGDGRLVGIGTVIVDGALIDPASITATRSGDPTVYRAADVSRTSPVAFGKGDVVTLRVSGHRLAPGEHHFEVEVFERDAGALQLALTDSVKPAPGS